MKSSLSSLPRTRHLSGRAFGLRALLAASALILTGCASTGYDTWYRINVDGVVRSNASLTNWPRLQLPPSTTPTESSKFADANLATEWNLWDWNIKLVIKNKTDQPLSILWPEARVAWNIGEDNLQNTEQRFPEITLVSPEKSATYNAFPKRFLHWMSWGDSAEGRGHWMPMGASSVVFQRRYSPEQSEAERQGVAREAVGRDVTILLPLRIRGERINYVFRLRITDAKSYGTYY